MTISAEVPGAAPDWLTATGDASTSGTNWLDQLEGLWDQHASLAVEADTLRRRLSAVEQQLDKRASAMTKAQELFDMLRELGQDVVPPSRQEAHSCWVAAPEGIVAPVLPPVAAAAPAVTPEVPSATSGEAPSTPAAGSEGRAASRKWRPRLPAARIVRTASVAVAGLFVAAMLFLSVGPRFLPYQSLVVRSGSMSPTIPTGSLVLYRRASATQIKVGDVIVFAKPGSPNEKVTHRVYKIGEGPNGRYFETKGDANGAPDAWRIAAVGTGWVAFAHVAGVGYVLGYLQTPAARMGLIVIPALLLGVLTLVEIWRPKRDPSRLAPA